MKPLSTDVTKNPRLKWSLRFQNLTRIIGLALPFWFLPQPTFLGTAGLNQDSAKASTTRQTLKASRDLLEVKVPSFSAVGQTITLRTRDNQYYSLTLADRSDIVMNISNLRGVITIGRSEIAVITSSGNHSIDLNRAGWSVTSRENPQDRTSLLIPQGLLTATLNQGYLNVEILNPAGRGTQFRVPNEEGSKLTLVTWVNSEEGTRIGIELNNGDGSQSWLVLSVDNQTNRIMAKKFNSQDGWTKHTDRDSEILTLQNGTSFFPLGSAEPPAVFNFTHQVNLMDNLAFKPVPSINKKTGGKTLSGVIGAEVYKPSDEELFIQVIILSVTLNSKDLQNPPWENNPNWTGQVSFSQVSNADIRIETWKVKPQDKVLGMLETNFLGNSFASPEDFEEELRKKFENYELVIEKKVADEDYVFYKLEFNSPSNSYSLGIYRTDQGWVVGDLSQNRSDQ